MEARSEEGTARLYGSVRAAFRAAPAIADEASAPVPWSWRVPAVMAALAAGALLALVIASWGWRWFGQPPPTVAAPPSVGPVAEAIVAAAPFGRAVEGSAPAVSGASPAASSLPVDMRLLGVFAGRDGDGYALIRLPDRGPVLFRKGQDIAPGATLEAVRPNGILVREAGGPRDILLRQEAGAAGAGLRPAATAATAAAAQARAACALPTGFSGPVYRLNAELLTGMAAQPQSWAALLVPTAGALVVRDGTGLAAMLGMKAGDRMVQANGIALGAIDDVLTAVVKPLTASRPVRLTGTRDGKPREWLFLNAGTCPA